MELKLQTRKGRTWRSQSARSPCSDFAEVLERIDSLMTMRVPRRPPICAQPATEFDDPATEQNPAENLRAFAGNQETTGIPPMIPLTIEQGDKREVALT